MKYLISVVVLLSSLSLSALAAHPKRGGGDECEMSFKAAAYRVRLFIKKMSPDEAAEATKGFSEESFKKAIVLPIEKKTLILVDGEKKTAAYNYDDKNYELNCERFEKAAFVEKLGLSWHEISRAMGRETDYEVSHQIYNKIEDELLGGAKRASLDLLDDELVKEILGLKSTGDGGVTAVGKAIDLTKAPFLYKTTNTNDPDMTWVLRDSVVNLKDTAVGAGQLIADEAMSIGWLAAATIMDARLNEIERKKIKDIAKISGGTTVMHLAKVAADLIDSLANTRTKWVDLGPEVGRQELILVSTLKAQRLLKELDGLIIARQEMWKKIYDILGESLGNNNNFDRLEKLSNPTVRSITFLGSRSEVGFETAQIVAGLLSLTEIYNVTDLEKINDLTLGQTAIDGSDKPIKMILYSWAGTSRVYLTKEQSENLKFVLETFVKLNGSSER